ncbi:MAG TPA: AraC family transcriptional regulator [Planctomycetota bacterium]|nr:AraC family transcriptional regulator [Planctomycetota bacterium]
MDSSDQARGGRRGGMGHARHDGFEMLGEGLTLMAPYLVTVQQEAPGIDGANAMPWNRLFVVPPHEQRIPATVSLAEPRQALALEPGTITWLPSDARLHFRFPVGFRMIAWHFRLEWAPGVDAFAGVARMRQTRDATMSRELDALARRDADAAALARLRGLLLAALSSFIDEPLDALSRRLRTRQRYGKLLAAIDQQPRADLGVAEMAREIGLGREGFTRAFRRDVGLTPREYLRRALARHASQRLLAGESVTSVAEGLRFSSPFWFSRFFKARLGAAPSAFGSLARR